MFIISDDSTEACRRYLLAGSRGWSILKSFVPAKIVPLTLMLPSKFPAKPLPVKPKTASPSLREFDPPSKKPPSPSVEPMQQGPPPPPRPTTALPPLKPPPPSAEIPAPPVLKMVVVSPLPPKVTIPSPPSSLEPLATVKPTAPMPGLLVDEAPAANSPSVNEVIGPTITLLLKRCSEPVNVLLAASWA